MNKVTRKFNAALSINITTVKSIRFHVLFSATWKSLQSNKSCFCVIHIGAIYTVFRFFLISFTIINFTLKTLKITLRILLFYFKTSLELAVLPNYPQVKSMATSTMQRCSITSPCT